MKKIDFLATDGVKLDGLLYENQLKSQSIILAVHGMASNCFKARDEIIAKECNKEKIDYFCFNNRGSELVKYIEKNNNDERRLGGTSYEEVLEGYEDIVGAILKLKELGYQNIYLQGHSLGSTKIVYTYNKLKDEESKEILRNIKGVILLSLIDIPTTLKIYLGDKFENYLIVAEGKEKEGKQIDLMPKKAFIHPISVKTFLRYARDHKEIDFAKYGEDTELKRLNNITTPLFMRWGNRQEMIVQKPNELVTLLKSQINNPNKDIAYIEGANHNYEGKEEILAKQIVAFIKK